MDKYPINYSIASIVDLSNIENLVSLVSLVNLVILVALENLVALVALLNLKYQEDMSFRSLKTGEAYLGKF